MTSILIILIMTAAWVICIKIKNFGYVDFVWSASFSFISIYYFFSLRGWAPRKLLFVFMVCFWSLRLASHLFLRLTSHHPQEDVRYVKLREQWAKNLNFKFFIFFQFQALAVIVLTPQFYFIMQNRAPKFSFLEYVGAILWALSLFGETLSDKQLKDFKNDPNNKGKVCDTGLWRYSRHPNYFFEWMIWNSYFIFSLASPGGWLTIYTPLLMLFFLTKMTGIPITEEMSLKNRGDVYRDYQRRTSKFIPWFPRP